MSENLLNLLTLNLNSRSENWKRRVALLLLLLIKKQREEENQQASRRWWVRPVFPRRVKEGALFLNVDWMKKHDPESFCNFLRVTPKLFDYILNLVYVDIAPSKNNVSEHIAAKDRLALVLRYLAGGDSLKSLSYRADVPLSSTTKLIKLVCEALWRRLMPIVLPVPTTEKWMEVAKEMDERWQFPHCVGAIDSKHVVMQAQPNDGWSDLNKKGTHSIVLLAVCDANYKFILVDIGGSGRNYNRVIFAVSAFGRAMNRGTLKLPPPSSIYGLPVAMPYFFVGDAEFPLKKNLMKPYPGSDLDYGKRIFNYRLLKVRRTIQNAFGILSARFRVFQGPINAKVETVCSITKAAVCLHNLLLEAEQALPNTKKTNCSPNSSDTEDEAGNIGEGALRRQSNVSQDLRQTPFNSSIVAAEYRDWLKYFCTGPGSVNW